MKSLLSDTFAEWTVDKAPAQAAALAYYTLFSLAPLLVIVIAVAGLVFGQEAARGEVVDQIRSLVGDTGATAVQDLIVSARTPATSTIASGIGILTFMVGAAAVFLQLQDALNTIWDVPADTRAGVRGFIRIRLRSFAMVLACGFIMLASLILSAAVAAVTRYVGGLLPGAAPAGLLLEFGFSMAVLTVVFALMFKYLPDTHVPWSDVWVGATGTAVLFNFGKSLVGLYLGHSAIASTFGAAASLVVILVWVYYAAQIVLFGAEFTWVWASHYGSRAEHAPQDAESAFDPLRPLSAAAH